MKYILNIKPFKEFWFNCYINNMVSIISSSDPTYKYVMYSNSYFYDSSYIDMIGHVSFNAHYIKMSFSESIDFKKMTKSEGHNFANKKHILDEIYNNIEQDRIISPLVDLFYWYKDSLAWQTDHGWHYSVLVGYNTRKKIIYALEDDIHSKYGIVEIPDKNLITALNSDHAKKGSFYDYLVLSVANKIRKFSLHLSEIIQNIHIINKSIKNIEYEKLFIIDRQNRETIDSFFMWQPYYILQILNRIKGNSCLFEKLFMKKVIDSDIMEELMQVNNGIENLWQMIRNIIIKSKLKKLIFSESKYYDTTIKKVKEALSDEIYLWQLFEDTIYKKLTEVSDIDIAF